MESHVRYSLCLTILYMVGRIHAGSSPSCFEQNTLYVETSLSNVATIEDCYDTCNLVPSCKFFTYNVVTRGCGIRSYEPTNFVNAETQRTGTRLGILQDPDTVFVGFATRTTSAEDCQKSCQGDVQCMTFTWNGPSSANPNICVHNYGELQRRIPAGAGSGIVSGPKFCPDEECCQAPVKVVFEQ